MKNEIFPDLIEGAEVIREDSDASFIEGYITLENGECLREVGDGTGIDEHGQQWMVVSRSLDDDDFEFETVGWTLSQNVTYRG